jgi:phosphate transport system permease protein
MAGIDLVTQRGFWPRFRRRTGHGDVIFRGLTAAFALFVMALVLVIGAVVWEGSSAARQQIGLWSFLTTNAWNPVVGRENLGALAAVYGTLMSSLIALLIAGPLGLFIGIFLSELCPRALRTPLSFLVELLAAIPSVVYGLWGALVLGPFILTRVTNPLASTLHAFSSPQPRNLLLAGLVLAIMILPTIAAISRDVLQTAPVHQREALLALGATRWEVIWKAVVPYARAGIIGGVMLGLGRALGETMAATMVIGNNMQIGSLVKPAQSAASLIATQLPSPNSGLHASALIMAALVLFGITLLLNALARLLVWQVSRGPGGEVRA